MAATGTPDAGHTRRHARGKKRKLTKAAERAATPAVLAIKTVQAQVMPSTEKSSGTDVFIKAQPAYQKAHPHLLHISVEGRAKSKPTS